MAEQDFKQFRALDLFCSHCKRSTPVREHLLLVLPTGNKFDYLCSVCGTRVGSKTDEDRSAFTLVPPR
jgi:hypothetical protein